jgi:ABC-type phosphate transport system substrate-binding protein
MNNISVKAIRAALLMLCLLAPVAFGQITIDGSSTVYPITLAVAEEFNMITQMLK